jgi:hypothetical protein
MKAVFSTSSLFIRWLLVLALVAGAGMGAPGRALAGIFYSNTNQYTASSTCATGFCVDGVYNAGRAADANLDNYASLRTFLASNVSLQLGLSGTGQKGDRAGIVVSNGSGLLNIQAVGAVKISTYLKTGNTLAFRESYIVSASAVKTALLEHDRPTQLEFIANLSFNQIKIEIGGVNVAYAMNVHYAYAVPTNVQPQAVGYISRFGTAGAGQYSTAGTGTSGVCLNTDVDNPGAVVDSDLTNYASFSSVLTVGCPSTLKVKLEGTSPAGYYAGFMLGSAGLLDASVLAGLRITTSLNGVPQETFTGANLLELHVLPNGQAQVSFPSNFPFNEVTIERVGLLSALDNLQIYYGFGVEPRAFDGDTEVLSNFGSPVANQQYQVTTSALLCVGCAVDNPQNAANGATDPTSYAQMNTPLTLGGELGLRLQLNGTGQAGNRAGMVIGGGAGLLDVSALNSMTVSTYDTNGNILESRTGSELLSLRLLPDGRQEVYFNTTRDFASVQLTVASGVAALASTKVYYAFADDRTGGFPLLVTPPTPLPVELITFTARWANGLAELNWATASEKASSHFVVERATGDEKPFQAIGVVAAAGTSASVQKYLLRDAEAASQKGGVLYYRLRLVDQNDTEALSPVVALKMNKLAALQLQIYPNPAATTTAIKLSCAGLTTAARVEIYSEMGQLVSQQAMAETVTELTTVNLAGGLYHVVLRDGNGQRLAAERLLITGR